MDQREQLRARTQDFALRIIKLYQGLPRRTDAFVIGKQVLRSGTSIGANYRAACLSRSRAEFVARLGVVIEEANETVYWLELLVHGDIVPASRMKPLLVEANELVRIFAATWRNTKAASGNNQITKQPNIQIL